MTEGKYELHSRKEVKISESRENIRTNVPPSAHFRGVSY